MLQEKLIKIRVDCYMQVPTIPAIAPQTSFIDKLFGEDDSRE